MAVLYLLLKIAMNGYNLILFSMGCCSSGDQEYFRSMENEVQGMLKNSELLKNPKVASQLAKDVMEYMYCKIKKDYVVYLRKQIKSFSKMNDDAVIAKDKDPFSWMKKSAASLQTMCSELQKIDNDTKADLDRLETFLKTLEPKVNPYRDNNFKAASGQRAREPPIHKRSSIRAEQQKIEGDSPNSLNRALIDSDSVRVTQQLSEFCYRDSLKERIQRQKKDVSNTEEDRLEREQARNAELNKLNIYLQKQMKIGENVTVSLREDLRKLNEIYSLQKRQWEKKCQSLNKEVEETKRTFLTFTTDNSSMIMESIAEEPKENYAQIQHQEEIKVLKKALAIDSQVISEIFKSPSNSKRQKKPSVNSINESCSTMSQFQTIVRYFGHSKILPSFHSAEDAVKIRKDIINMFSSKISETRLLYAYDPINILSFNDYINKEVNLLVLVDIGNGTIVGGFAGEIDSDGYMAHSFLFSLRNGRQPLQLNATDKVNRINIDPSFLNFGNAELKIRVNTRTFISNISGFQSHYYMKDRRVSVQSFLGSEKREHTVDSYEIHQIVFQ